MWPARIIVHDRLDGTELRFEFHPAVLVHGDVTGVAPVRGRQEGVVRGRKAHLERQHDWQVATAHHVDDAQDRAAGAREGSRIPSR
jgi:hypothetical protein